MAMLNNQMVTRFVGIWMDTCLKGMHAWINNMLIQVPTG